MLPIFRADASGKVAAALLLGVSLAVSLALGSAAMADEHEAKASSET